MIAMADNAGRYKLQVLMKQWERITLYTGLGTTEMHVYIGTTESDLARNFGGDKPSTSSKN